MEKTSTQGKIGISSVQFSSVSQLCLTLCNPMNCSTPGFLVHHQLPELAQTHVPQVSDAIQPSHPLSSPSPPAFNLPHKQYEKNGIGITFLMWVFKFSCVQLFTVQWTVAHQVSLSTGFSQARMLEWVAISPL